LPLPKLAANAPARAPRRDFDARNPSLARFDKKTRDSAGRRVGGYSVIASRFVDEQLREMARGRSREDAYDRARTSLLADGPKVTAAARLPASLMRDVTPHPLLSLPPSQAMQGILEEQLAVVRAGLTTKGSQRQRRTRTEYRTFRDEETNRMVQQRELGGDGQWAVMRKAAMEARTRRVEAAAEAGRDDEDPGLVTEDELAAFELSDGTLNETLLGTLVEADRLPEEQEAALRAFKADKVLGAVAVAEAVDRAAERALAAGGDGAFAEEVRKLGVDPASPAGSSLEASIRQRAGRLGASGWERRLAPVAKLAAAPVTVGSGDGGRAATSKTVTMTPAEWAEEEARRVAAFEMGRPAGDDAEGFLAREEEAAAGTERR